MKIAILGTRGIPANYSGFETFAEELSVRLVRRGHDVTVYGRAMHVPCSERSHKDVKLVILPTIRHKYFDTIVHTFLSMTHALFQRYDAVIVCNCANSPFCLPLRLTGAKVLLNADGQDWKRKKWNALGRAYYKICERLAAFCPTLVIADAEVVRDYYAERYGIASAVVAYGSRTLDRGDEGTDGLADFGLEPGKYVLYVARLEPENGAHVVVKAFEGVKTGMKLAVVGSAPYNAEYIASLKATKDPRIVFTGGVYDRRYFQLQRHAYLYVQACEVGGTHPSLLEGMGAGNCVVYNDVPEHREVVGDAGVPYAFSDPVDLRRQLQRLVDDPETVAALGQKARARVRARYDWERVTSSYERLCRDLVEGRRPALTAEEDAAGGVEGMGDEA